ncbi:RNA-binding protein 28 isoform X2 [Trichomycterus rosablanca]|uniref:RNA-binding protein 28 isoform X2 n=1 Tax=Trichomycterus rosablanca TaxID=2290929 RepID=UPI002F35B5CF
MSAVTLFVRNLPTSASNQQLEEIFSEIGPVKRCFVVKDKGSEKCRGIGYVTYSMAEDAQRAIQDIKHYDGKKISVIQAKKKINDRKKGKAEKAEKEAEKPPDSKPQQKSQGMRKKKLKAKLIVRNLSFKCSEEELKQIFSKYGTVLEANIPLKPDGKKRGFAFVQFKNMLEAGKALAATNLKEIKDRKVAVDWAVSKDKFLANQSGLAAGSKKDERTNATEADEETDEEESPEEHESGTNSQSEEEEDDDDDDGDDGDDEEDKESQEADSDSSLSASDEDDDDEDDDDEDDDDGDVSDEDTDKKNKAKKKQNLLPSDVNEGKTLFIRNLSFDSEEEGLEEVLLQFGELRYVRVVVHPETGLPKGCAFAQFKSKEAAEKCLAAAQDESETGGVRVDGRKLNIMLAVSKEDAVKLKTKEVKTHKGSRNLYLAREGLIRAGTKAAEGVSDSDMAKRTRFEELKRAKLKNVNVFVSRTRLCIHNLPKSVDRSRLSKLCLTAAGGDKRVRIKECHVMYDRKPVRGEPMGHSLGYGFVEFQDHEHALQALRRLNNNPTIFGAIKRPIVEFSLEDGRKLKLKAMRLEKSKVKTVAKSGGEKKQVNKNSNQKEGNSESQQKSPKKNKAAVQQPNRSGNSSEQTPSGHYSGFRTTPEVEHVELQDGKKRQKVLPMPSHKGPKIRQRDKGKQLVPAKKIKTVPSRKEKKIVSMEKPNQNKKQGAKPVKRKFQSKEDDHFERLVEQYKKKLTGGSNSNNMVIKKTKWFS